MQYNKLLFLICLNVISSNFQNLNTLLSSKTLIFLMLFPVYRMTSNRNSQLVKNQDIMLFLSFYYEWLTTHIQHLVLLYLLHRKKRGVNCLLLVMIRRYKLLPEVAILKLGSVYKDNSIFHVFD